jgi:hypothetical protein
MSIVLSDAQKNSLISEREKLISLLDGYANAGPTLQAEIDDKTLQDQAFKTLFDYYNLNIIEKYALERRYLDGFYVQNPILEVDLQNSASGSGRLAPTPPATDPVRISQFDMTPLINTSTNENNELYFIDEQELTEDYLVGGYINYPTGINSLVKTASILTSTSTTIDISDTNMTPVSDFQVNQFLIVEGSGTISVAKITNVSGGGASWTLDIKIRIPPANDISPNALIKVDFIGFSDAERHNKSALTYDDILQGEIAVLESQLNGRLSNLNNQITNLQANEDSALNPQAELDCVDSKDFIETYLLTTDISDSGLFSLNSERTTRRNQITLRVVAITSAYTSGAINFLDARYDAAKSRANTMRGTISLLKAGVISQTSIQNLIVEFQNKLNSINSILAL